SLGRPGEAMELLRRAKVLDAFFEPSWYWPTMGYLHFLARDYDDAIAAFTRKQKLLLWAEAYLAACYAFTGRADLARERIARVLQLAPGLSLAKFLSREPL